MTTREHRGPRESAQILAMVVIATLALKVLAATASSRNGWFGADESLWSWIINNSSPLLSNLWVLLILGSAILLLPGRLAIAGLLALEAGTTVLLVADLLHVRFYGDALSIAEASSAGLLAGVIPNIRSSLERWMLLYFLDWPLVLWLARRAYLRGPELELSQRLRRFLPMMLVGLVLVGSEATRLAAAAQRIGSGAALPRVVVASVGLLPYHAVDLVSASASNRPVTPAELDEVMSFIERHHARRQTSDLFGTAARANVILISAESFQSFVIGLSVGGQLVAPNLTKLTKESLYFGNFLDQTHLGTTSDAEFAVLQGLHPLTLGVVSFEYRRNEFYGLARMLADAGYATVSACAAPATFWHMAEMHRRLGFQMSMFGTSFTGSGRIGAWLGDREFFDQMVPVLERQREPFGAFLLSSSNHHPFDLPDADSPLDVGEMQGTLLGKYLQTAHYFDAAVGRFIERLRTSGLLDRTALVIYGDHQGFLGDTPEMAALLRFPHGVGARYEFWRNRKRVPLIIRLPGGAAAGERADAGGHVDVPVTILSLVGLADRSGVMLGRDLTAHEPALVVFRDGSFADDTRFFIDGFASGTSPGCFRIADGAPVDCRPLDPDRREAMERLRVSDLILRHNLIPAIVRLGPSRAQQGAIATTEGRIHW